MIHIYANTQHIQNQEQHCLSCEQTLDATPENIQQLLSKFSIPTDFFTDALDLDKRPRIEQHDQATLLLIHIPQERSDIQDLYQDVKYRTVPFAMILTATHFITVSLQHSIFQTEFMTQHRFNYFSPLPIQAALLLLNKTALQFTRFVQQLETATLAAEDELSRSYRNQELYTLLYLNESFLYTTSSLKQMIQMISSADFKHALALTAAETEYLQHSLIEFEQVYSVAQINQLNLNNVMDAYGNVIQNNVSHVVKLLTAVTIVLSVPTLIASVYGMNVPLPFQHNEHAFSVIIAMMLLSSIWISYYFYKKQYF